MKWYYVVAGGHSHVRVFLDGAKCGDLCFRNEELHSLRDKFSGQIQFIDDTSEREDDAVPLDPTARRKA